MYHITTLFRTYNYAAQGTNRTFNETVCNSDRLPFFAVTSAKDWK